MLKTAIICFSLCYFLMASGITINIHFCGDKIKEVSLYKISEDNCCGAEEENSGCCDDDVAILKIDDAQHSSISLSIVNQKVLSTFNYSRTLLQTPSKGITPIINFGHSPPVFYDDPIYIKNRVLII